MAKGERIGAVFSAGDKIVEFLGYGRYDGEDVPGPEAAGAMAEVLRKEKVANPKLVMDNGDVVYGCECWWGAERSIKNRIDAWSGAGYEIREVRIADMRKLADVSGENGKL